MKLALYSFAGSALVLAGIIAACVVGGQTMNLAASGAHFLSRTFSDVGLPAGLRGLRRFSPACGPFTPGRRPATSPRPTAASMLLAGVVMKLGAYGCLRVAMTLFPAGSIRGAFTCSASARGATCSPCSR